MARKKLSEYRSKHMMAKSLGIPYEGWEAQAGKPLPKLSSRRHYVVKVDQAVKQRFKRGLIALDVPFGDIEKNIASLNKKGYQQFIIEPFRHYNEQEHYISLKRDLSGIMLSYSQKGGVEIEAHHSSVQSVLFHEANLKMISRETGFSVHQLEAMQKLFDDNYLTLLEINPYIVVNGKIDILDAAFEVDSAAADLVDEWSVNDIRSSSTSLTEEEKIVLRLNEDSPASLSLEVIDTDGEIFLLLSGGGASIVVADEIFSQGKGKELANYGEYSGNPSEEETRIYTEQVLSLLLKSKAKNKRLFIGGAVANFTDIANTFNGIIMALNKYRNELQKQNVKVYVRRGGPRQQIGLSRITRVLEDAGLLGGVYDPSTSIPSAVRHLLGYRDDK